MTFRIEFYTRVDGSCQYHDYVDVVFRTGRKDEAARIRSFVDRLAQRGSQEMVKIKAAEKMNDVWQLRPLPHRVLYFLDSAKRMYVILNGFRKKSGKTPQREISRAERLRDEYLSR